MAFRRDGAGSERLRSDDPAVWLTDEDRARIVALLAVLEAEAATGSYVAGRPRWSEEGAAALRELDDLGASLVCYRLALADTFDEMGGLDAVTDHTVREVTARRRRAACWAWAKVRKIPTREANAHFGIRDY